MRRHVVICLLLAGVTLGLYWPVQHYGLVLYDDPSFLTDCPEIQTGLNWHSFLWSFSSVILANWHPVTTLSFVIDHQLFGTNPGMEHVVNVLFHAANAVLLFLLLHALTRSTWRSALVAAVFAWHPLRVESVAWITERKDVLCGFFFLLTLWFYARQFKVPGPKSRVFYAASLLAFVLGLMSKAMLVTVPFVLLLLDVWPLQRWTPATGLRHRPESSPGGGTPPAVTRLIWEKWPFFLISGVFSILTFAVQKNHAAVVSLNTLDWNYRIANTLASYLRYLAKLFWPTDLAIIYPYVRIDDWGQTGMIALVLAGVSAFCLIQWRKYPWLAVGWFWYLGTSVPVIGLVQIGESSMSDRYTYLTLLGPVMALMWQIPETWGRHPARKVLLGLAGTAGLGALLVLTRVQIQYWHDTISLFAHTLAVTRNNPGAESGLGIGLADERHYDEALAHFRTAQALDPTAGDYFSKSGYMLMRENKWAEAAEDMTTAASLEPNDLVVQESLGTILPHLGRNAEGRQHWETALKLKPNDTELLNNLAWSLATNPDIAQRDGPEAVKLALHACELTHYQKTIFIGTLAAAYAEAGRFDDAIATARRACANASARGESDLLRRNQELLAQYQSHQAHHEPGN